MIKQGHFIRLAGVLLFGLSTQTTFSGTMGELPDSTINWTGFYGGANLGYMFSANKNAEVQARVKRACSSCVGGLESAVASAAASTGSFSLNNNGFIGGGQFGYNASFYDKLLAGFELDIQGIADGKDRVFSRKTVGIRNFPNDSIASATTINKSIDYLGTARAKLGFLVGPSLLLSGTGGLAYGRVNLNTGIAQTGLGDAADIESNFGFASKYSGTRTGWTGGGVLEWMFHSNWSAMVEYLYYDLGTVRNRGKIVDRITIPDFTPPDYFTNAVTTKTSFSGSVIRIGINYHL